MSPLPDVRCGVDLETASAEYLEAARKKRRFRSLVAEIKARLVEAEALLADAESDVRRFDEARKDAGWRPPTPHEWGVRKTKRNGVDGSLVVCRRCGTRIFMPYLDGELSDFGRKIRIVMHFLDETLKMPKAFYKSMSVPSDSEHFPDEETGLHGRLANDCDLVVKLPELLAKFRAGLA